MSDNLDPTERALVRNWLSNCIERLEAMPPTPVRSQSLRILRADLERHSQSNVIPFHRRQG
jgi:hypothetical protein